MSTRSYILIKTKNKYVGVYCHNDGYPSHNGSILNKHYTTKRKIKKLFSLGYLSFLDSKLMTKKEHSFNKPIEGVTIAYHRDRGDEFRTLEVSYTNFQDLFQYVSFVYVFEKGKWTCFNSYGKFKN